MINSDRLLERFLRYVQVDTTAGDGSAGYPSSPGQIDLGRILLEELRAIGLEDADQDQFGIVMATLPANRRHEAPLIAFNAHVDTSPETTGKNVKPQVWRDYDGRDLVLPGDQTKVIHVDANPELRQLVGRTIITSDGTTLLGADDKAGLAVIMEAIAWLAENPHIEHGPVRVLFTCDEEIGHGVDYVDIQKLGATVCYTLDGSGQDEIDVETFSADLATVTVRGVNIHPSIAKGRMTNAVRVAGDFVSRLPRDLSPETTDSRQGFLHPYLVEGGVAETRLRILLRDFDTSRLAEQAVLLRQAAAATRARWPGSEIDVAVTPQYRNMVEGLAREPRAVAYAEEAHRRLDRRARRTIIRGGTDGSRLTELGLPTPNLSAGEHNPHSPLEWTCLEEMVAAAEVVTMIVRVWADDAR
ncbi:MAG TPA: peptidase T [Pirellulales bacterium]|nr:peptidase T [Pirellulales bacterium]